MPACAEGRQGLRLDLILIYQSQVILLKDEIYEDEDLDIDIFVETEDILSIDEEINKVVFDLTKETDFLILPTVAPMESCPVKR